MILSSIDIAAVADADAAMRNLFDAVVVAVGVAILTVVAEAVVDVGRKLLPRQEMVAFYKKRRENAASS